MARITIRNLDDAVMRVLRTRAAAAGRTLEEEAGLALAIATGADSDGVRARLTAVRHMLRNRPDTPAEGLVRDMRDSRTRDFSS